MDNSNESQESGDTALSRATASRTVSRFETVTRLAETFYRVEGSGKPVMLVHGFGEDGTIWDGVIEGLKNRFSFIIPDLPGSGRSPLIEDMSIEGMAEVIYAIIQQEEIEKCPMIGHSMGGYITLAFCR